MSTYIIGDVHGCGQELQALIQKIAPASTDEIILVGDVIDRGFHGHLVWELIQQYHMKVLLGNHENKMKKFFERKKDYVPAHYLWAFENLFETTKVVTQPEFEAWLQGLPLLLQRGEDIIVHAGINVFNPTAENEACNVYGHATPTERRTDWWELYNGSQMVVYGHVVPKDWKPYFHKNRQGRTNSVCIDTCTHNGGDLTAYCLETGDIIQHRSGIPHFRMLKEAMNKQPPTFRLP